MASNTLYPPIIDSTAPAFLVDKDGKGSFILEYSPSAYSAEGDWGSIDTKVESIHVSVVNQKTGKSVIKKINDEGKDKNFRYRELGYLIINKLTLKEGETDVYQIEIFDEDILGGWVPGTIYKIQIRLSQKVYNSTITDFQTKYGDYFSEWSTYCTTKAIIEPKITTSLFEDGTKIYNNYIHYIGTYKDDAVNNAEMLYSYRFTAYDNDVLIYDSDILYANQYNRNNVVDCPINYLFQKGKEYKLVLEYKTINKYQGIIEYPFEIEKSQIELTGPFVITVAELEKDLSQTKATDEDEGRICLFFKNNSSTQGTENYNYYLLRSDETSDFTRWEEIAYFQLNSSNNQNKNMKYYYDYTIESGINYKYALQLSTSENKRSALKIMQHEVTTEDGTVSQDYIVSRNFEFSYLVGEGGKQLKLKFNNTVSSYNYNFSETKVDTIGSQFPFIIRGGNTKYRTFPLGGLISYEMDDLDLFIKKLDKGTNLYRKERYFRDAVLEFLQDGKPKLFKSPSEGNILIRIMQPAIQPNQTLNRLIGSFTSNAVEIGDVDLTTLKKYGIIKEIKEKPSLDFETYSGVASYHKEHKGD